MARFAIVAAALVSGLFAPAVLVFEGNLLKSTLANSFPILKVYS